MMPIRLELRFIKSPYVLTWIPTVVALLIVTSSIAGDWPQWRGLNNDAHLDKGEHLPTALPESAEVVWRIKTGPGHAAPVVSRGLLAVLEEQGDQEMIRLIDAKTGNPLWQKPCGQTYEDEYGIGPRCAPLIDGDRIYTQTCRGELSCFRLEDGRRLWGTSYQNDFGVKWIKNKRQNIGAACRRGYSGTPLINGDHLIAQVGSDKGASVVCFNKRSGKIIWRSENDLASYASPLMATLGGKRQFVSLTVTRLIGLDAGTGELLWEEPLPTLYFRNVLTPVAVGNRVIAASHSEGMVCMTVTGSDGRAVRNWKNKSLKINLATPVEVGGHLYGFAEKDRFVCVDTKTGRLNWENRPFGKFYASSLTDGKRILVLAELGELVLLSANPEKYDELGRLQVCGKTWSYPAYADSRLFVRDKSGLQCIQLGE